MSCKNPFFVNCYDEIDEVEVEEEEECDENESFLTKSEFEPKFFVNVYFVKTKRSENIILVDLKKGIKYKFIVHMNKNLLSKLFCCNQRKNSKCRCVIVVKKDDSQIKLKMNGEHNCGYVINCEKRKVFPSLMQNEEILREKEKFKQKFQSFETQSLEIKFVEPAVVYKGVEPHLLLIGINMNISILEKVLVRIGNCPCHIDKIYSKNIFNPKENEKYKETNSFISIFLPNIFVKEELDLDVTIDYTIKNVPNKSFVSKLESCFKYSIKDNDQLKKDFIDEYLNDAYFNNNDYKDNCNKLELNF